MPNCNSNSSAPDSYQGLLFAPRLFHFEKSPPPSTQSHVWVFSPIGVLKKSPPLGNGGGRGRACAAERSSLPWLAGAARVRSGGMVLSATKGDSTAGTFEPFVQRASHEDTEGRQRQQQVRGWHPR